MFCSKKHLSASCRVVDISASGNTVLYRASGSLNLNGEIASHQADERYEIVFRFWERLSDATSCSRNCKYSGLSVMELDQGQKYRFMRDYKAVLQRLVTARSIQLLPNYVIRRLKMPS